LGFKHVYQRALAALFELLYSFDFAQDSDLAELLLLPLGLIKRQVLSF
jgi:hypothetical protein